MLQKLFLKITCFLLIAVSLLGCAQQQHTQKKHLFILSGQSNMANLNPEKGFVQAVEKEFGDDNVIVVKDAAAGRCIINWDRSWKTPGGVTLNRTGDLYNKLIVKVITATVEQRIASITFIWMQGECDTATAYTADMYAQGLWDVYSQLQDDLHRKDINMVIGRISDFDINDQEYKYWSKIRETEVKFAESNPRFAWVDTDDLNDAVSNTDGKKENLIHYTKTGYKTLEQRFAESAIRLIRENL